MADNTETKLCEHDQSSHLLPIQPYTAMYYHYGMLLGVDDFVTDQSYHRGKMHLHNAWLHGTGVIWGLEASADLERNELRVAAGLALDGYGRELHNDSPQCVDVGKWFADHKDDPDFSYEETNGTVNFDAHVAIRHRVCLMRPVPALLDTCEGASSDTAYSRIHETVEILLKPGSAPPAPKRNHLLRVLYGLEAPARNDQNNILEPDKKALDARETILGAPVEKRISVAADQFKRFAALDAMGESLAYDADEPEAYLFPEYAPADVVLAELTALTLQKEDGQWRLQSVQIDNLVRDSLLATSTIQDLLPGIGSILHGVDAASNLGPRVISIELSGTALSFEVDQALNPDTVVGAAFVASQLEAGSGWQDISLSGISLGEEDTIVRMTLDEDPGGNLFRLVAIGTGTKPIMGVNNLPLAGDTAYSPQGAFGAMHGRDFVWMIKREI